MLDNQIETTTKRAVDKNPFQYNGEVLETNKPVGELEANRKHFYIESYGCQMNFSDSEIVASILQDANYAVTSDYQLADLILINTCSIREKAEETVRKRLKVFDQVKRNKPEALVGVLGCMAERLKAKFLEEEKLVDIVTKELSDTDEIRMR